MPNTATRRDVAEIWTCVQLGAMFLVDTMLLGALEPYMDGRLGLLVLVLFVIQVFVRIVSIYHPTEYAGRTITSVVVDIAMSGATYVAWTFAVPEGTELTAETEDFVARWTAALRVGVVLNAIPDVVPYTVGRTVATPAFDALKWVAKRAYALAVAAVVYNPVQDSEKKQQ